MFEKVNPYHPDKVADRIAGAIVDLAYTREQDPKCAVEVLIGHHQCSIIIESSVEFTENDVIPIVSRIAGVEYKLHLTSIPQDANLANNQAHGLRCGDNGIFRGAPVTSEEQELTNYIDKLNLPHDGKFIFDKKNMRMIICQSCLSAQSAKYIKSFSSYHIVVNPLGEWTGGCDVDSGATNRKLGSDMGYAVTGGGLHGKDLSKADVSVNIYAHLLAQKSGNFVNLLCAIGDNKVAGVPYDKIVETARNYIKEIGGFEKFAEWGLIRPEL